MIPMLVESVSTTLIGTVSTALISNYSDQAASALGTANVLLNLISLCFSIIITGATVLVSHMLGAEEHERSFSAAWTAVILCASIAFVCGIVLALCADPIMTAMHLNNNTHLFAVQYFRLRCLFLPIASAFSACLAVMRCYGYPQYPLILSLASGILNYFLCLLVLRFPQFCPVSGVVGVAAANIASQAICLTGALVFLRKLKLNLSPPKCLSEGWGYAKRIVRIGIPSAVASGSYALGQVVITSFVGLMGDAALSGKVYFTTILSYTYLFSFNLGSANTLLVGRLCGRGEYDRADRMTRQLLLLTVPVNLLLTVTVFLLRFPLVSLFTENKQVLAMSTAIILIDILAETSRAVSHIYEYALRGAGDVTFSMIATIASCWIGSIGLGYLFGIVFGWGLTGCWLAMALDELVRALATGWRWKSKKWRADFGLT